MKLPNREEAIVPEAKITLYLLNTQHPKGRGKAKFFVTTQVCSDLLTAPVQNRGLAHCKARKRASQRERSILYSPFTGFLAFNVAIGFEPMRDIGFT